MMSSTWFSIIAIGLVLFLIQMLVIVLAFGNMSKEDIEEMNEKRKSWMEKHPFLTLLLILLPTPIVILVEAKLIHRKIDDREINYSALVN